MSITPRSLLLLALIVAGCVPYQPPPVSPQLQKVYGACAQGNRTACQTVSEVEARQAQERQAAVQPPPYPIYIEPIDPEPFMRRQPTTTTCTPGAFGQFTCRTQ